MNYNINQSTYNTIQSTNGINQSTNRTNQSTYDINRSTYKTNQPTNSTNQPTYNINRSSTYNTHQSIGNPNQSAYNPNQSTNNTNQSTNNTSQSTNQSTNQSKSSYFDEFDLDLDDDDWLAQAEYAHSQAVAKHETLLSHVKYEETDDRLIDDRLIDDRLRDDRVSCDQLSDDRLIDDGIIDLCDESELNYDGSAHSSSHATTSSQNSSRSCVSSPQPPSQQSQTSNQSIQSNQSMQSNQSSDAGLHYSPTLHVNEYGESVPKAPCALQPRTAWDMLYSADEYPVLCSGLPELDRILRGGLRSGITEIAGEAGAAKSQLCFQLLLQVQLPKPSKDYFSQPFRPTTSEFGLDGCALYIGTEGEIPIARISSMQRGMYRRVPWTQGYDYMGGIFPVRVQSMDELQSVLKQAETTIVEKNIRLIVIDSIAGLLRVSETEEANHASSRVSSMFDLAATLKKISTMHQCIIVVANQVTDRVRPEEGTNFSVPGSHYMDAYTIESSGRQMIPSLGISWSSCINTRLVLARSGGARGHGQTLTRSISIQFSPHCKAKQTISFEVNEEGIC